MMAFIVFLFLNSLYYICLYIYTNTVHTFRKIPEQSPWQNERFSCDKDKI